MSNQIQNQMSDEQLDAISGGCYARECGEGRHRKNDCDDERKNTCWDDVHKPRREYNDCRPSYRPHRCG